MKREDEGYTRLVFVFSKVVIKFPRLLKNSRKMPKSPFKERKTLALGENMIINFNEFIFFILFRPKFCLPTYFSFFGLFNIQKRGEIIYSVIDGTEEGVKKYEAVRSLVKNKLNFLLEEYDKWLKEKNKKDSKHIPLIAHNIISPNSLYFNKNRIQVADYGDLCVARFIRHFNEDLSKNLVEI